MARNEFARQVLLDAFDAKQYLLDLAEEGKLSVMLSRRGFALKEAPALNVWTLDLPVRLATDKGKVMDVLKVKLYQHRKYSATDEPLSDKFYGRALLNVYFGHYVAASFLHLVHCVMRVAAASEFEEDYEAKTEKIGILIDLIERAGAAPTVKKAMAILRAAKFSSK